MCDEVLSDIINTYFACLIFTSFTLYTILLIVHWRIRKCFHPFFSILFGLIVFCYQICALCVGIQRIFYLTTGSSDPSEEAPYSGADIVKLVLDYVVNVTYAAITPLFLSCLIERIIATLASKRYEHCRQYPILIGLLLFVAVVTYIQGVQGLNIGDDERVNNYIMIALSVVMLCTLASLFFINQRLIRRKTSLNLSVKYQLTENVRVVRNALIPVVICDTAITINDLVGDEFFAKEFIFKPEKCDGIPLYLYAFVIMNTLSLALEFAITLVILCRWEVYKKVLPSCFTRFNQSPNRVSSDSGTPVSVIRNVFGERIDLNNSTSDYFSRLKAEWDNI